MTYKTDLHCHTSEASGCAHENTADTIRKYMDTGYTTVAITNHFYYPRAQELSYSEYVEQYWNAFMLAKNTAEAYGNTLHVIPGIELTLDTEGGYDYLVFGIDREILHQIPLYHTRRIQDVYVELKQAGCLVLQAHPFRGGRPVTPTAWVDGYEVINTHPNNPSSNHRCVTWARSIRDEKPLIFVSGTDHHDPHHFPRSGILTDTPVCTVEQLQNTLLRQEYSIFCENVILPPQLDGDSMDFLD